jgi:hypothetical protein
MESDPVFDTDAILLLAERVGLFGFMNSRWGWPMMESMHFLGLSLLFGSIGLIDLRLLGFAGASPVARVMRLAPLGVIGWAICVTTGMAFFMSAPAQYLYNPAFQLKTAAMMIAGLNVCVFYTFAAPRIRRIPEGAAMPFAVRASAGVSFFAWVAVITFGRLLTFFRPPYHWCGWCG